MISISAIFNFVLLGGWTLACGTDGPKISNKSLFHEYGGHIKPNNLPAARLERRIFAVPEEIPGLAAIWQISRVQRVL
jgi:hypothetical protein